MWLFLPFFPALCPALYSFYDFATDLCDILIFYTVDGSRRHYFVGVANYQFLFNYSDFWQIMRNTGVLILLHVCFQIPLAALVAFLLFRTNDGFRFFRAVYFLPSIIAATVIG